MGSPYSRSVTLAANRRQGGEAGGIGRNQVSQRENGLPERPLWADLVRVRWIHRPDLQGVSEPYRVPGKIRELAQFDLVTDLEVNAVTSTVSQVKTLAVITVYAIVGGDMRYGGEACKVPTRHDHHGETPTRDQSQRPGES